MIPAKLQDLIEKFYAGETTEYEEGQLKAYFDLADLPTDLAREKEYFMAMRSLKSEQLDEEFEKDLFNQINKDKPSGTFRIWGYSLSAVAAAIAVFLMVWFGTDLLNPKEVYGTINDPHIAFNETQKALDEVSKKMNKGLKPVKATVEKVEENVKKTGEVKKIDKALNKARSLHKLDEASELLKSFSKVYVNYGKS